MKKIVVIGVGGSGKTTLAKALGKQLNIPNFDLDDLYWLPEWRHVSREEYVLKINAITANENWIISGNFSEYTNQIWEKCTMIIWLDYSLLRCLYQAFTRSLKRIIFKEPCCNGNIETFTNLFFSKNSIFFWVINSYKKRNKPYNKLFNNQINSKKYLRFLNPEQLNIWLKNYD